MYTRAFGDALLYSSIFPLLFRREIAVRLACLDQLICGSPMLRSILRLKYQLFIVVELEPPESFDDGTGGFLSRALKVGIFNSQQELATHLAGEKPVEQR